MSEDDISDEEGGGASGFSIFTSQSLADARDEIFSNVRAKLPELASDDELSDDDGVAPIFSSLAHTAHETADLSDPPEVAEPVAEVAPRSREGVVAAAYASVSEAPSASRSRSQLDAEGYAGMDSGVGRPTVMSNEEYRALRRGHRERWLQEEHAKMYGSVGAADGTLDMASGEALEQLFFKQIHGEDDTETSRALASSQAAAQPVDLGIDRALASIDLDRLLSNVRSAENAREKELSGDVDPEARSATDQQREQARAILQQATTSLHAAYQSIGRETPAWEAEPAPTPSSPSSAWADDAASDEARAAQNARLATMRREETLQKVQEEALLREQQAEAAGDRRKLSAAAQIAAMQEEIVVDDVSSGSDDDPVPERPAATTVSKQPVPDTTGLRADEIRARAERRAAARSRGGGRGGRGVRGGRAAGRGGGRGGRSNSDDSDDESSSSGDELDHMAVRRRMKESAAEAKKIAPPPAPARADLQSPPRDRSNAPAGTDHIRTPTADAQDDEDSDDDKLFFTPAAPPTSDDIYARAFDQIVPEMDITDFGDDGDNDGEKEEEDLSGLSTVEREMKIMEQQRQTLLRQSVPDDWKPHAVVADEAGEDTVIEVELDDDDKAAMAKLRVEMNRRWKELHPTQSRHGEPPLKPQAPPSVRPDNDSSDMVDAGAEAAEEYRKRLSARLAAERQEMEAEKKTTAARRTRQPRPKISFEPRPLIDPQPSETEEIVAAAIPLMEREQQKADAKAEAIRIAEEENTAAKAALDAEAGRAELERQLSERKGGLFSPTFTFEAPLSGLPLRAKGEICVLAVLDTCPLVTADIVSWLMGAPIASKRSLQIPGGARVVGALLTSSAAIAANYSSSTASTLADDSERCILLALEVPEHTASVSTVANDDYQDLDDKMDDFLRRTYLSQVLQSAAMDAFSRTGIASDGASANTIRATLASICKVLEPYDSMGNASSSLLTAGLSVWINGLPVEGIESACNSQSTSTDASLEGAVETTASVLKRDPGTIQRTHLYRILSRVDDEGLDLVGMRIFYPTTVQAASIADAATWAPPPQVASLVIAVRGVDALSRWQGAVGPDDPLVARKTDPRSLRATLGTDREDNLLTCARATSATWFRHELPLYFGGRLSAEMSIDGEQQTAARLAQMAEGGYLPGLQTFRPASALLLFSPTRMCTSAGGLAAAAARGMKVQAMTRTCIPPQEAVRLVGTNDGFGEESEDAGRGERLLSCLVIVSRENLEQHLPRCISAMIDRMEASEAAATDSDSHRTRSGVTVTGHRVPAREVPVLAPLLMAPAPDAWRPLSAPPSRPFYTSDELPDMTVVALAGARRALWPQVLLELMALKFSIVALKVLPKLPPELAASLWLPEPSGGVVCLVSKRGGTAELQALQSSPSSKRLASPRGGVQLSLLARSSLKDESSSSSSAETLRTLLAEQPRMCTVSRDPRTAYGQAIKCFSLTDFGQRYDGSRDGEASSLELTRRAFTRLFPSGPEVTTVGVEIAARLGRNMPRQLRQLYRAGFGFERLQMVATSPDEPEPRLLGLLRRETAAESLASTVHAHRLEADVAPLEPAAVEAILPVGRGGGAVRRLVRPASTLKETVCVVCLPTMLRDSDGNVGGDDKAVEMGVGIGVLEELAAEGFKLVGLSLRKLQAAEAETYAADYANTPKARGWTLATLEAALMDGPALLLVVEKENGASRLSMLLQGGASTVSSGRRMGGGAAQTGAIAAAAASQPPEIFVSTTAKAAASDIPLLFSELHGSWAALEAMGE